MKAVLSFLAIAILSGCACPVAAPKIVEVPIAVTCVKSAPVKPIFPFQGSSADEDLFVLAKRMLAEIEIRKGYEGELEAVVYGCTTISK